MAAVTGAPLSSCTTTLMSSPISFPAMGSSKAAISLPFRLINATVSLLHFPEELGHVVFCTSINIFVKQLRALQNHLPVAEEKDNGARCKKGLGVNNRGSYYMCLLLFNKRVATLVYFSPSCFTSTVTRNILDVFCEFCG